MVSALSNYYLDSIVNRSLSGKNIASAVFSVLTPHKIDLISTFGNIDKDSQYYIASINKFFISSIILKLSTENKINLNDKISKYLLQETVQGLHVYEGKDYSNSLKIVHLISLTSGLPCYLTDKQASGKKAMTELEAGVDQSWPIEKIIQEVKMMKPHFPPGEKGKAKYSDTNHHILSLIIERIMGRSIDLTLEDLFRELGLTNTYVCKDIKDRRFVPIRYKSKIINIPKFLTSTKYDIISTAKDQMVFLKTFFDGYFFPKNKLKELEKWNNIFFPFKYGVGIQKFSMPRIFSPIHPTPEMIGHCGSTGSVAFFIPERNVYITGTVNQQASPQIAFQVMIKIAKQFSD